MGLTTAMTNHKQTYFIHLLSKIFTDISMERDEKTLAYMFSP